MIKEVLDAMRELAATGMTMLCVTHEMGFAREVADRMAFFDEGMLVKLGNLPPDLHQPPGRPHPHVPPANPLASRARQPNLCTNQS